MPKTENKMTREEAIDFLEKEGIIEGQEPTPDLVYDQEDEKQIKYAMKNGGYLVKPKVGRAFGDPIVEIEG